MSGLAPQEIDAPNAAEREEQLPLKARGDTSWELGGWTAPKKQVVPPVVGQPPSAKALSFGAGPLGTGAPHVAGARVNERMYRRRRWAGPPAPGAKAATAVVPTNASGAAKWRPLKRGW